MIELSGGEALAKSLVGEGVEVVFGIPGIQIYGIVAAIRDEPGIRMIATRHEQATTYMADGYARASGKPGVALVVPGVGLYNAASGLTNAYSRSTPVLLIAGQIPRGAIGKNLGAVHEIADQAGAVRSVTKWQRQASRPREVPDAVYEAFRQMRTGRPRPVLIEMPPEAGVEREEVRLRSPAAVSRIVPSPEDLREAARVISRSALPLIYAGGGVARSDAEQTLVKLAEATNIPVITSSGGKGVIPDGHPLSYGSCFSPRGERQEMNQLYEVMQSADVVIGIGARFSLGYPAPESSTLVNINIDDTELTRHRANIIPLHGDAGATMEALLPHLIEAGAGDRPSPAEAVSAARRLIAYYDIRLREPQYPILEAIRKGVPDDGFVVWDVTQFGYYARTHWQVHSPEDVHRLRLLVQPRLRLPHGPGSQGREARPPSGLHDRGRRVHVQLLRALHGCPVRHRRRDRGLQQRLLRQRGAGPGRRLWRSLWDRPAQPGLRQIRRVVRRRRHEGERPHGAGDAHSAGVGAPGPGDYRRALWRDAGAPRPAVRAVLQPALDHAPGGADTVLMRWSRRESGSVPGS